MQTIQLTLMSQSPSNQDRNIVRKRPHSKSRAGCYRCKAKKIKCDQRKPSCSLCERYSEPCIYPFLTPDGATSSRHSPERPSDVLPQITLRSTSDLNVDDLELLHHWTVAAYDGFGDKTSDKEIWQVNVPRIGLQHPWVMQGILSVSALHLAGLNPISAQNYIIKAAEHQNKGLSIFHHLMSNIDKNISADNCDAVLTFGALAVGYAFASPTTEQESLLTFSPYWCGLLDWVLLLRGPSGMRDVRRKWAEQVVLGPMAYQLRTTEPRDFDDPFAGPLTALEPLVHNESTGSRVYQEAYELMRIAYRKPWGRDQALGYKLLVYRWIEAVSGDYLNLLGKLDPTAMIIFAYISALIHQAAKTSWYMRGAAEKILGLIHDQLPEISRSWIMWPVQVVRDDAWFDQYVVQLSEETDGFGSGILGDV